jgi:hypothetical protein
MSTRALLTGIATFLMATSAAHAQTPMTSSVANPEKWVVSGRKRRTYLPRIVGGQEAHALQDQAGMSTLRLRHALSCLPVRPQRAVSSEA